MVTWRDNGLELETYRYCLHVVVQHQRFFSTTWRNKVYLIEESKVISDYWGISLMIENQISNV